MGGKSNSEFERHFPRAKFFHYVNHLIGWMYVVDDYSVHSISIPRPPCFRNTYISNVNLKHNGKNFFACRKWTNGQLSLYFGLCSPNIYIKCDLEDIPASEITEKSKFIEMRYSIIVLALIASASAMPSNSFSPRQADICSSIGSSCDGSEKPTCCQGGKPGFASCKKHKIKLTACKDGCGGIAGVIQCIDNPQN